MINPGLYQMVGYWAMEGADSANEPPLFGNITLNNYNSVGTAIGKINNGRDFEKGQSDYFISSGVPQIGTGDLTVGFWWKPEAVDGVRQVYFNFGGTGGFRFRVDTTNKVDFAIHDGSVYNTVAWGSVLVTGTWYYIVGWHDSVGKKIYLNINEGTPVNLAHTTGMGAVTENMYVGQSAVGTYFSDGVMDELFIYRRLLSAYERSWFYNSGNGRSFSQLMKGQVILL
ncbi:MAG TPA: LamG domain-containing protein [Anaerolineaceae bacterium]|nr:LamG domain-containing protein [Anaerolineaceae bacterium]